MENPAVPRSESIHASLLPSACTLEETTTSNRIDPYWDRLWAPGSQANWATGSQERAIAALGSRQVNQRFLMTEAEAIGHLISNRGRSGRLATWGAIDSWTAVSAEQLAALSGDRTLLDPRNSGTAAAFSSDLIDIGAFPHPVHRESGGGRGMLYRAANSDAFEKLVAPTLTYPEWVSVTGGLGWSQGGHFDRHNILMAELALRAAEYLPVGAILGEKYTRPDLLFGEGSAKNAGVKSRAKRADGLIVRKDGLRIAVEITATASQSLEKKIDSWAALIEKHPLETSGVVVLFVVAPHPAPKGKRGDAGLRAEIFKKVAEAAKKHPGLGGDAAAARIGVVSWEEWFPARHELSEDFLTMRAHFATGEGKGAAKWERRQLFGDYGFMPWKTFDATAVIDNAKLLAASPHWLRTEEVTHLLGTPMERARTETPVPSPVHPNLELPLPLGAGRGVSADAQLPPRLRVLPRE